MARISAGRFIRILFFLALVSGAVFCLQRVAEDIFAGRYFADPEEFRYEVIFLSSYLLIVVFILRYGYYLARNRVSWKTIKDDPLFLLNKRYFTLLQWNLNLLLFWLSLAGFICSLAISAMKGKL